MAILFQVLRGGFYFLTLIMGVFLLRWEIIFGENASKILMMILMPGYLLLCGVMVGYLVSIIWAWKDTEDTALSVKEQILKTSFIIGIVVGILLALGYIIL